MSFTGFKLDKIVCATPTAVFSALKNAEIMAGLDLLSEHPAGHPAPLFGAIARAKPAVKFSTPQLDTLVSSFPVWGANPSCTLYRKKSGLTAPLARDGTVHDNVAVTASTAFWDTITLPARGIGAGNVTICSMWNGTNNPLIHTGSAALASTLAVANYFAAGPIQINGTAVNGIEEVTIQSGANFQSEGDADSIYDTFGEVRLGQTVVTIKTKTQVNWATYNLTGAAITTLVGFMKKWANEASFVADATAEHIKYAATQGIAHPINSTADEAGLWSDTLAILCLAADGTTAPLTFTASQAIAFS
jgi:hypothetical protein